MPLLLTRSAGHLFHPFNLPFTSGRKRLPTSARVFQQTRNPSRYGAVIPSLLTPFVLRRLFLLSFLASSCSAMEPPLSSKIFSSNAPARARPTLNDNAPLLPSTSLQVTWSHPQTPTRLITCFRFFYFPASFLRFGFFFFCVEDRRPSSCRARIAPLFIKQIRLPNLSRPFATLGYFPTCCPEINPPPPFLFGLPTFGVLWRLLFSLRVAAYAVVACFVYSCAFFA